MKKAVTAEKKIERELCEGIKDFGGRAYKLVSPGRVGMPDRLVCLPTGDVFFVELKSENGKLSRQQELRIAELKEMQQQVCVLYGREDVKHFIDNIRELMNGAI